MEFDFPTPRPHFIILFNNKTNNEHKSTLKDLTQLEIQSILDLVQSFIAIYCLTSENITLSFHTGYWVRKTLNLKL